MPHVLIAGSTGSGKSVAINAMIMSRALQDDPGAGADDPRRSEARGARHVRGHPAPVYAHHHRAEAGRQRPAQRGARDGAAAEAAGLAHRVRNIDQYNKLFDHGTPSLFEDAEEQKPLPYIVIIIDELADLMMLDRANVEESITRLAQMARAVGIHLVLATQRPSVDVITGLIKANVPTRITFRLATKVDSRTILDSNGAEALLGRGDMLFLPPGTVAAAARARSLRHRKGNLRCRRVLESAGRGRICRRLPRSRRRTTRAGELDGDRRRARTTTIRCSTMPCAWCFEFGKASTSLLQRRLRIGYGRAAHLIDLMERDGLVGPADGSRPREILKPAGWLQEVEQAMR